MPNKRLNVPLLFALNCAPCITPEQIPTSRRSVVRCCSINKTQTNLSHFFDHLSRAPRTPIMLALPGAYLGSGVAASILAAQTTAKHA